MAYVGQGDFNQVICTNYGIKAVVVSILTILLNSTCTLWRTWHCTHRIHYQTSVQVHLVITVTYQTRTLFQGGVAIVYIPHVDLSRSGGMLPQECVVTLDVRRSLLRSFFGLNLMFCKQNCYMYSLCGSDCRLCVTQYTQQDLKPSSTTCYGHAIPDM